MVEGPGLLWLLEGRIQGLGFNPGFEGFTVVKI